MTIRNIHMRIARRTGKGGQEFRVIIGVADIDFQDHEGRMQLLPYIRVVLKKLVQYMAPCAPVAPEFDQYMALRSFCQFNGISAILKSVTGGIILQAICRQ